MDRSCAGLSDVTLVLALQVKLTWGNTQIGMAARGHPNKYYPIHARSTGASSPCRTNIPQALEDIAAYKQDTDDRGGFAIELLRQTVA